MWRLILVLLFLIASVFVGIEIVKHQGYVLIVFEPWMMQMPIWFAFVSTLVIFVLFFFIINSIDALKLTFYRIKNWLRFHKASRLYNKTQHGLSLLIEGNWKKSEKLLLAGSNQSPDPLINFLGAAYAAHELCAYDRRDHYIQNAYQAAPNATLAIGLTQANLEYKQKHFEHALATLHHLRETNPYQPRVLKLLEKIYIHLGDWQQLLTLLPSLRKAKIINSTQKSQFEKNTYIEIFNSSLTKSREEVRTLWHNMPRDAKKDPNVIYAYLLQLIRFNIGSLYDAETLKETEILIRKALKNEWHPGLITLYGNLPFSQLNRQFVIVGAWLKIYGDQAILLYILGKWCVQAKLWGKAKDYFERCIALGPNKEASFEYGRLLESLGEKDAALRKYREGLLAQLS